MPLRQLFQSSIAPHQQHPAAAETPFSASQFHCIFMCCCCWCWWLMLQSSTFYQPHCLPIAAVLFFPTFRLHKKQRDALIFSDFTFHFCALKEKLLWIWDTLGIIESSPATEQQQKKNEKNAINKNETMNQMSRERNDMRRNSACVVYPRRLMNRKRMFSFSCRLFSVSLSLINNKNRWQGNW